MFLQREQVNRILNDAPSHMDREKILDGLVAQGFELEGVDMDAARQKVQGIDMQPQQDARQGGLASAVGGFARGAAKDVGSTLRGLGVAGQEALQQTVGRGLGAVTGRDPQSFGTRRFEPTSQQFQEETEQLQPEGFAEQAGSLTSAIAQFALPLGAATKATRGAGLLRRAATEAGATAPVAATRELGEEGEVGAGTAVETGLAGAFPFAGALSRLGLKFGKKGVSEISGALTGTGGEVVEEAASAAAKGGESLSRFTKALRGETTPEQISNNVREAVGTVEAQRNQLFRQQISELGDQTVSTNGMANRFINKLNEVGIRVSDEGLDFSGSKLRTVPAAQSKIQKAFEEIMQTPQQTSVLELDTTRQALRSLRQAGDDPSANLANKLIDDATREVRRVGENVTGYGQMLDQFSETSDFLDELQRGISAGDKATIDQTFRGITKSLKTNNEQRAALVRQLDEATDGSILSDVAGQQLSELLPRGIFRQIIASLALGSAALPGGQGIATSYLPALLFSSPRITGEFVRALGIGRNKADMVINTINNTRKALDNAGLLKGAGVGAGGAVTDEI